MPKPSRWTADKRYEIVLETLRAKESIALIIDTKAELRQLQPVLGAPLALTMSASERRHKR